MAEEGKGLSDVANLDLRERFWRSSFVLCCIRLASSEIAHSFMPQPMYFLLSRASYFPPIYEKLFGHFRSFIPPRFSSGAENSKSHLEDIWLESELNRDKPLDWRSPIGVVLEQLSICGRSPSLDSYNAAGGLDEGTYTRPFDLVVHFQAPHLSNVSVVPFISLKYVEESFMNALRKGLYLQHGTANAFMRFPKTNQTMIVQSVLKDNEGFDLYWEHFGQVGQPKEVATWKQVGVKFNFTDAPDCTWLTSFPLFTSGATCPTQPPGGSEICSLTSQQRPTELRDLLYERLSFLYPKNSDSPNSLCAASWRVYIMGLQLQLETPLLWLVMHLAYFDQFLHLTIAHAES